MQYGNTEGADERAHPIQSDLDILYLSTYTTVSIYSVNSQRRPRSACANEQADQGLCCTHLHESPFHALHIICYLLILIKALLMCFYSICFHGEIIFSLISL